MTRRRTGVLEAPEESFTQEAVRPRRVKGGPRRDVQEDFAGDFEREFGGENPAENEDFDAGRRTGGGVRRKNAWRRQRGWRQWLPKTRWGMIAAGVAFAAGAGLCAFGVMAVRSALLHDARFVIPDSAAIKVEGNRHVTKAQLLSIFGEDVDRNILRVPLEERQVELQRLPWVEHATIMRLLPDHLRIVIVERTPVAFVRQGSRIGLVDKNGVMMDFAGGDGEHYSFPVVTGINFDEPLSVRAARMKMYERFMEELGVGGNDPDGKGIFDQLSEVDLSSPEDVKALIADGPGSNAKGEVLVHFGDSDFLERYNKYRAHLAEWRAQYPRLASVDMRYERQAVLEMQGGGSADPAKDAGQDVKSAGTKTKAAGPVAKPVAAVAKPVAAAINRPAPIAGSTLAAKTVSTKSVAHSGVAGAKGAAGGGTKIVDGTRAAAAIKRGADPMPTKDANGVVHHLTIAKDVSAKKPVAKKPAAATKTNTKKTNTKLVSHTAAVH